MLSTESRFAEYVLSFSNVLLQYLFLWDVSTIHSALDIFPIHIINQTSLQSSSVLIFTI